MKLIVGLGNPGREYVGTRHNVGFDVVDALASKLGWIGSPSDFDRVSRSKFDGLAMDGVASLPGGRSEKLLLLKPWTFMNLSGKSVQAAIAFYQLTPGDMMVVLDDLALPCGRIRIRANGSSGGHNGLKDIERVLGTSEYPRLRVGIDAPPGRMAGRDYVLAGYTEAQRPLMDEGISRAGNALLTWAESGTTAAMNKFNAEDAEAAKKR